MSELGPCVSIHDLDANASRGLISHSRSAAVSRRLAPTKAPKKLAPQKDNAKTEWGARLESRVPPPASWQQTSHRLLQDPSVTAVIVLRIQYVKNGQGH